MPWSIICGFVALFVLANAEQSGRLHRWDKHQPWKTLSDNLIDIDVETEKNNAVMLQDQPWHEEEMSGSGSGMDTTDDEDLLASGSGSGGGVPDFTDTAVYTVPPTTTTTRATTTTEQLTPCQQLREATQHLSGTYVPTCNDKGDYDILQCHGHPARGKCWCADLSGREIPGTPLETDIPDCVGGTNLPRCVFQLVWQMRTTVIGSFRPKCTVDGDFESTQCKGSICYCVDQKFGDKVTGTEVFLPDRPVCDGTTTPEKDGHRPEHRITLFPLGPSTTPRVDIDHQTKININLEGRSGSKDSEADDSGDRDSEEDNKSVEVSNDTGNGREPVKEPSSAASMMTQPGILAAIIGGGVVLLLCAVLLAMFIIYRMKKKDEGSYPLDEPKKMPNYSYQRAPEKEFYA